MRPPDGRAATRRLALCVTVAVCLSISGSVATASSPHGPRVPASLTVDRLGVSTVAPVAAPVGAVSPAEAGAPEGAPTSWSGTTVATLFPNYNASLPGLFRSLVDDWEVGAPAVVPSTGTVWWPELPVSLDGSPSPLTAPALLYNLSTGSFVGFDRSVSNVSAFAFDPDTSLLYATDPVNDTVEEIAPATGVPTGTVYHVGSEPSAIAFDVTTGYLFVANSGSNSVTVINPSTHTILWASVAVGTDPTTLADDGPDGWMYVGNAGSSYLSRLDVSSPTTAENPTLLQYGPARGLAFSARSDYVAVTTENGSNLTIVSGSSGAVHPVAVDIGTGFSAVVVTPNGSTFVVANGTGDTVALVNSSTFAVSSERLAVGSHPTLLVTVPPGGPILAWNNGTRNVSMIPADLTGVQPSNTTLAPTPDLLAYDPSLERLYVGDTELPGIEVLDPFTGVSEAPPIPLPGPPLALVMAAGDDTLYVALSGEVVAYNISNGSLAAPPAHLSGANGPMALDPANGLLWVGRPASNEVLALSSTTLSSAGPVVHLKVSSSDPASLVFVPTSNSLVAVNSSGGQVVQFNGTTGAGVGTPLPAASAGTNLTALMWDPADDLVYAAGDDLSAVNPATMAVALPPTPIAPHTSVGGMAYDASREAIYVGVWTSGLYSGLLSVVNGSSVAAEFASITVVPTGFEPSGIVAIEGPAGDLPDSGTVLVADAGSGTISVVASPPQILSAAFEPAQVDENVSTRLTVFATGGATTSSVSFTGLPTGCSAPAGFSVSCTPNEGGTFTVVATVTDALGETASDVAPLTVASSLTVAATVGALASHEADLGIAVAMSALAHGGTLPYIYAWAFGDGSTATGASTTHRFERTGEFIVAVTVTDPGGGRSVNETLVDVVPLPSIQLTATPPLTNLALTTDVNRTVELAASVAGGAAPGSGLWNLGDGTTSTVATVDHAWQIPHLYDVTYTYTDALGQVAEQSLSALVDPQLTGEFSAVPLSSNPIVGTVYDFNATPLYGTGPYTVVWSFGDGSTAVGSAVTHAYAASGTYDVEVSELDAAGAYFNLTLFPAISVGPGPSRAAPLFGGGFGPSFALGLVLGGVVAAVALFVAERSRRAGPTGPPSPYVPPPPPPHRGRS